MTGPSVNPRETAERRVRNWFEGERTRLVEVQHAQRRNDLRDQKLALDHLTQREEALKEERRLTLERIDREWQRQRDRLGHAPLPAPSFGMMAPVRNIQNEYDQAREQYLAHREHAKDGFDERAEEIRRGRMDKLHTFQTANQVRDANFQDARLDLAERQSKSFERLVEQEIGRSGKSMNREFARASRSPEHEL